jgi:hypothetical protein
MGGALKNWANNQAYPTGGQGLTTAGTTYTFALTENTA